jgi:hypothetical protein
MNDQTEILIKDETSQTYDVIAENTYKKPPDPPKKYYKPNRYDRRKAAAIARREKRK